MLSLCLNLGNLKFTPGKEGSEIKDQKLLGVCADQLQARTTRTPQFTSLFTPLDITPIFTPQVDAKMPREAMGGGKLSTHVTIYHGDLLLSLR